ncbi:nucleotidyltransferase domain-containing protein [Sphaerochaeta sp.]|jgi:predicted nucleotidyltransferase|uniref:nucleotidyltransferase domain-containing protein n=1 Tax=Sphaerochaeta sp. TaxID=1972642 RepID=UPI003D11C54C
MKSRPDATAFGLKPEVLQQLEAVFQAYKSIESVVLYGSRAKGTYHAGSDIDITIKGDHITDSLLGKIEEEIDDLLLPYSFDISSWQQIDNPALREHIERVGVVIYQRIH